MCIYGEFTQTNHQKHSNGINRQFHSAIRAPELKNPCSLGTRKRVLLILFHYLWHILGSTMCKNTAGTLRICVEHIAYDGETSSYIIIDVQLIFWQTERRNGNFQNFDTKYWVNWVFRLDWMWTLDLYNTDARAVRHTVSLRAQTIPEALAKFWLLVGSIDLGLGYTVRKLRSMAFQRCIWRGGLHLAKMGENEDFFLQKAA